MNVVATNQDTPDIEDAIELDPVEQGEGSEDGDEGERETDEFVVSFGDEEPEPVQEDAAPSWVKDLRRENRELKRQINAQERPQAPAKIEVGPEPSPEDFYHTEDPEAEFKNAYREWFTQQATVQAEAEKLQTRGKEIVGRYEAAAKALPVRDFDEAQEIVRDAIGIERWGYIVAGADAPERLVYALAKNPAKLAALAKIDIPARFAFEAAKLEKDMKVASKRKAPEPDEPVRGAAPLSVKVDATEARLEKEADKSGDRTALIKYRREKRAKE